MSFYYCTDFVFLISRHDVKNICSNIHCVKYVKTRATSGAYFPVYDSALIREITVRLCPYTKKHGSERSYTVIREKWKLLIRLTS